MSQKIRLDQLLVEQELCESRTLARAMILAGKVRRGSEILDKPGKPLLRDTELTVEQPPRHVSRAGDKLAGFLDDKGWSPKGKRILDVGASTGGFTDCLLQRGAIHSTCIDVGRAQLHQKLLLDFRVVNLEKIHAADLPAKELPYQYYDWIVMDLSFISLKRVLESVWSRLSKDGLLITLIKPQFEATKDEADAGKGIIRNPEIQERVCQEVIDFAGKRLDHCQFIDLQPSTLKGTEGNQEFLAAFRKY